MERISRRLFLETLIGAADAAILLTSDESEPTKEDITPLELIHTAPSNLYYETITTIGYGITSPLGVNIVYSSYTIPYTQLTSNMTAADIDLEVTFYQTLAMLDAPIGDLPSNFWNVPANRDDNAPKPYPFINEHTSGDPAGIDPRPGAVHLYQVTGILKPTNSFSQPLQIEIHSAIILRSELENT
ncbi:MAG TPA: hypothetical protein VLG12_06685 [Candidatus Saccharimonadales bacterium]|nr:hypothetical protein [Candidatus Saccharimonadales bacterium]